MTQQTRQIGIMKAVGGGNVADLRHVCCADPGLWAGCAVDRHPAGKWSGAKHRRRDGGIFEFPSRYHIKAIQPPSSSR